MPPCQPCHKLSDTVSDHAFSHFPVHPAPTAPLLRPAGPRWPLSGIQAMQPAAHGRRLGGNRKDPSELAAPAIARQRPRANPWHSPTQPSTVGRLTARLIKVIKHDHLPSFLRYNLPPIIRDRKSTRLNSSH